MRFNSAYNSKFAQKWPTVVYVNSSVIYFTLVRYDNSSASNAISAQISKTLPYIP
ncbi:hypothetical protein ABIB40_004205 [Pedobacter sp. UYP30]|uniref:hypothetical protein n=1 Tax=Pedobacter sp. UYP30 TaxID=1756400 RepID=UPI003399E51B